MLKKSYMIENQYVGLFLEIKLKEILSIVEFF
jgi:hypothetical protein